MTFDAQAETFLQDYYRDEVGQLAQEYPKDSTSLWIDYADLYQFEPDLAHDFRIAPDEVLNSLAKAVQWVDLPIDPEFDPDEITVRVYNLGEENTYAPGAIREEQGGKFVAVRGTLERITTTSDLPEQIVFRCQRCSNQETIPQDPTQSELQFPAECGGCDRQGPFKPMPDHMDSEWSDYAKLRIESRPDVDEDCKGKITGYVLNELIDHGGQTGLIGRAGEPVIVNGVVERVQKQGRGENKLLFDHHLRVNSIEFPEEEETVDVEQHREEFERLAAQPDAIDKFAESIAPQMHGTDAWDAAFEFAVAYLFGAPRIDIPRGPTYRGDLHFLIITDFGMGKSTVKEDIAAYSPNCISKSTTALSSGVGLTAAAVKDDFGEGQWTIKPGLLVRANGGHLLLDEIDKGPDELTDMNDALEGEQKVDIEKAGKSATYHSKTALMALGNPINGRFDPHEPIADQLGISETLLSRFDGIVTMQDHVDADQDEQIAETWGKSYTEAQEKQHGDREEFEQLDRPVPVDVGQAWIQHARGSVTPILHYEQFESLKDWYAHEVRQLNESFAGEGDGSDMPVPATVRVLAAATKMAIAFARVHLRDEVEPQDIERAKKLAKRLVKQNWNGESFDVTHNHGQNTQDSRKKRVYNYVDRHGPVAVDDVAENVMGREETIRQDIEGYKRQGEMTEPSTGEVRTV